MSGDHILMYFAAVPPPIPAPITTTRPALPPLLSVVPHPASVVAPAAAAHCMNSRLVVMVVYLSGLHGGKIIRDQLKLRVGVTFGLLMHDGGGPLAVAKIF